MYFITFSFFQMISLVSFPKEDHCEATLVPTLIIITQLGGQTQPLNTELHFYSTH